ncbi:MAG TPA: hypothetical protein PKA28_06405 [Methylomusa anaerophila]|uniref:Flavodoxin n=1 Tax=Methylomusa anaerophila TaxID=1930071 RepID=A0A348AGL0_9FIRM|nr:hypothetical protein [Methylomusa anaerophila]BBB90208.1 hypothetical protein MAMMFC1_00856 [Methylomusa anaerophila]HML88066.1 hypothetical protein [Methylomusa anaerophila]
MSYKEATLYFMSGTGNSFRAAAWMGETMRKYRATARIIPLEKGATTNQINTTPGMMQGFKGVKS